MAPWCSECVRRCARMTRTGHPNVMRRLRGQDPARGLCVIASAARGRSTQRHGERICGGRDRRIFSETRWCTTSARKWPAATSYSISRYGCGMQPRHVDNAARWWIRPLDRTVPLAKIRIPRQEFEAPNQLYDREHMMFGPWNCLPEHRPLGSINRMRLAVYLASLQVRRKLNMVGA